MGPAQGIANGVGVSIPLRRPARKRRGSGINRRELSKIATAYLIIDGCRPRYGLGDYLGCDLVPTHQAFCCHRLRRLRALNALNLLNAERGPFMHARITLALPGRLLKSPAKNKIEYFHTFADKLL